MHKYSKNPLRFYGLQWYSLNFLYNIDQALKMQNGVQYTVFRSKIKFFIITICTRLSFLYKQLWTKNDC